MNRLALVAFSVCLVGCVPEERAEMPTVQPRVERPMMERVEPQAARPMMKQPEVERPTMVSLDMGPEYVRCDQYDPLFVGAANRHYPWGAKGEGARFLKAQAFKESSCRPDVCSDQEACGLMQHLPGTASDLGIMDRLDPVQSVNGGAQYMGWLYGQWRAHDRTFLQRTRLALDGYFRGLGRTLAAQKEWGCINWSDCFQRYAPPLTKEYVTTISRLAGRPVAEEGE